MLYAVCYIWVIYDKYSLPVQALLDSAWWSALLKMNVLTNQTIFNKLLIALFGLLYDKKKNNNDNDTFTFFFHLD